MTNSDKSGIVVGSVAIIIFILFIAFFVHSETVKSRQYKERDEAESAAILRKADEVNELYRRSDDNLKNARDRREKDAIYRSRDAQLEDINRRYGR